MVMSVKLDVILNSGNVTLNRKKRTLSYVLRRGSSTEAYNPVAFSKKRLKNFMALLNTQKYQNYPPSPELYVILKSCTREQCC